LREGAHRLRGIIRSGLLAGVGQAKHVRRNERDEVEVGLGEQELVGGGVDSDHRQRYTGSSGETDLRGDPLRVRGRRNEHTINLLIPQEERTEKGSVVRQSVGANRIRIVAGVTVTAVPIENVSHLRVGVGPD